MSDRGDQRPLFMANLKNLHHEGHRVVLFEPLGYSFLEHGRRKRPKRFAALYLGVEDVFHVGPPWIADDGAIPESTRTPLHPPLKPADHFSFRDGFGSLAAEF